MKKSHDGNLVVFIIFISCIIFISLLLLLFFNSSNVLAMNITFILIALSLGAIVFCIVSYICYIIELNSMKKQINKSQKSKDNSI